MNQLDASKPEYSVDEIKNAEYLKIKANIVLERTYEQVSQNCNLPRVGEHADAKGEVNRKLPFGQRWVLKDFPPGIHVRSNRDGKERQVVDVGTGQKR